MPKSRRRILLVLLTILFTLCVILGMGYTKAAVYRGRVDAQLSRRLYSAVVDANDQASRLTGTVQSNSAQKAGMIRQYIYLIDQINAISIAVHGESGRLVPKEALMALFDDVAKYEEVLQSGTTNTLEIRTLLQNHLQNLLDIMGKKGK